MIRNETEYQEASERLAQERQRLVDPFESFHLQLKEEVESYEKLKRGEFDELDNLRGLGHLLISIRIAQGLSQRDLAKRLNVHESQVSRDERNEYFGITLERAIRLLDALNVKLRTQVEIVADREAAVA
jgi:ribosome-binding protein aMBF1 (putative translation factor)